MTKEPHLAERIYFRPEYAAVARAIGYRGVAYHDLWPIIERLSKVFPKVKVESAIYYLTTFEGQMRCNPPKDAQVMFREKVRPLLWQLLGPPPEKEGAFWTHPDGTPRERPSFAERVIGEGNAQAEPKKRGKGRGR